MTRGALRFAALAAALALVGAAAAQTGAPGPRDIGQMTLGYTYYNRPGADLAAHNREVAECALLAGGVHSTWEVMSRAPYTGFAPWYRDPTDRKLAAASLENCMVVRGWRVVKVSDAEGKALAALPPADLAQRLAPWIGADDPHGQIVRVWSNDAAHSSARRYDGNPQRTKNGQLSLLAGAPELQQLPAAPIHAPPSPWVNPRWPTKPLKPTDLAGLRRDAGVLIVQVKNPGFHGGIGITFNRVGADDDVLPSDTDHAPDVLFFGKGLLFANPKGDTYAFAVPPGRWRIYGVGALPLLNFCLGSPSFEVKAGEIVYAGAFDLSAEDLAPDLDLTPATAWLGDPARSVRPAAYVNGSRGPCGDNTIYALEFDGAPFAPGYAWGSQASRRP